MTTVLIRRNAPTDSCHNLTALMQRCIKTSFLLTPHYICAHRNSDNLRNAAFIWDSLGNGGRAPYCGLTTIYESTVSTTKSWSNHVCIPAEVCIQRVLASDIPGPHSGQFGSFAFIK